MDIRLLQPVTDDDIGKFDIVHFHRRINSPDHTVSWIEKFKKAGAIVVTDIDDYWTPSRSHPAYELIMKDRINVKILRAIKNADFITTTTDSYAKHIVEKTGKEVYVIPNAIDTGSDMWNGYETESDRVRVGWIGGSSHEKDLEKLSGAFNVLLSDKEVAKKIQIVMCGYDTRGTVTELHPITKEEKTRKIKPEESIWNKFEAIFNDNGRADKDQYVRRNTLPITKYGDHYKHVDICLAPLEENIFNECKSELKIIETGMCKKALIASDLYVYHDLLTHGETGMLVNPRKNHKLWHKYIRQLVLDDAMRKEMGENIYKLVFPRYTLSEVTNDRCRWYKEILGL